MPNIIGEPFPDYVNRQINIRQAAHGSGINTFRTPDQLTYLNSKTAWVKLASSVKIGNKFQSKDEQIVPGSWGKLAKENVLFSGISSLSDGILTPKSTVEEKYQHSSGFGFVPMPGIIDASVKCENRGSIKKATVNIKCYSPEQFRILEVLYLRLGYTVFLEWGWSNYLDNDGKLNSNYYTLIESSFFKLDTNSKYIDFLQNIESYRAGKDGNYDGLLCKVSNFSWNFSADGSYDIQLSLISMGDVIESLKTNITPSKDIIEYISEVYSLYGDEEEDTDSGESDKKIPPTPANDLISAYFFLQRTFVARGITDYSTSSTNVNDSTYDNYADLSNNGFTNQFDIRFGINGNSTVANIEVVQDAKFSFEPNPKKNDFLYFNYTNEDRNERMIANEGFYVRFGHLIEFIRTNIILKTEKAENPIIEIDTDFEKSKMYVFPYQVSLDPRVCIVGTKEELSRKIFYDNLPIWNDGEGNGANIANIYLNCSMVSRVLGEKQDEDGNISLYEVLSTICSELNLALGSVNNLEIVIEEETNSLKIIDASYQPVIEKKSTELQLYGYNGNNSNFVHSFDLKTEITNDFATMVSIGSTAGGYAKGMENTMFSKWNKGLIDIFKENYTSPKQISTIDDKDPANLTYASEFWLKIYSPYGLSFPQNVDARLQYVGKYKGRGTVGLSCDISPELIDKNLVVVPEFYKYCQYKIQQLEQKYASPTNGFIPISLGITLEGISGIKIYNYVKVNTEFLPSNYPDSLKFIIKGVNHKISANNWETSLETVVISNSNDKDGKPFKSYSEIKKIVDDEIDKGKNLLDQTKINNENNIYKEKIFPPQNQLEILNDAGEQVIPLLDQQSIANANSFLEKSMKEAATTWFKDNGETKGKCGGVTYKLANRLARKLRNKYIADVSGNHAYSSVLRTNLKNLDIYQEISFQPYGAGLTNAALKETLKTNITPHVNYGDVLVYFQTTPPLGPGGAKYHAQIWTGNLYKGQTFMGYKGVGWTTDGKTNYGSNPGIVYGSPKVPWTLYWFRIKNEYKNTTGPVSSTPAPTLSDKEIKEKSARGFNNLTYRLSLIYQLKDDYGTGTYTPNPTYSNQQAKKYLFYDAKGVNDDELKAVRLLEQWLENQTQKVELEKLTTNDFYEFKKYLTLLISRTKTGGDDVIFKSAYNNNVKKVTIDPNF